MKRSIFRKIGDPFLIPFARFLDWIARHTPLKKLPKTTSIILLSAVLLVLVEGMFLGTLYWISRPPSGPHATHAEFVELVKQKKIADIAVKRKRDFQDAVYIGYFTDITDGKRKWAYLDELEGSPIEWLRSNGYNVDDRKKFGFPLGYVLMFTGQGVIGAVPFFFFMWLIGGGGMRSMGEEFSAFRSSKILLGKQITFADVGGMEPEKEMLRDYLDFLKNPKDYQEVGAQMPKGVLLVGFPGTGKTLLARAFAGEAGVPTYMVSGSDFHFMLVGVGANRAERLFDQAKRTAPSVLIIDELDSAAPQRSGGGDWGGADRERASLTNKLLSLLDELDKEDIPVIVFGLTNRIDALDSALLREKRFDRHIHVAPPDLQGRLKILEVHTTRPKQTPLGEDVDFAEIARRTPGWVGSKLATMVNEAKIKAVKNKRTLISQKDFFDVIDIVELGPRAHRELTEEEQKKIAGHEVGHTLATFAVPGANPLQFVTLEMHGSTLGHTSAPPERDYYIQTETQVLARNKLSLAGLAAELVMYGERSTASGRDIEVATLNTRRFVFEGMDKKLGPVSLEAMQTGDKGSYRAFTGASHTLEGRGEERVRDILLQALDEMVVLYRRPEWNKVLMQVAERLYEEKRLTHDQVKAMIPPELLIEKGG